MAKDRHDKIVRDIAMKEAMSLKVKKDYVQFKQGRKVFVIKRIK